MKFPIRSSWFFYGVLLLHAAPVLWLDYIVTGDGPCHFYNSRIIYEWLFHGEADFFKPYFVLNVRAVPNWTTNLIQVPLLVVFSPKWAEKVFFLLYLSAFAFGFRRVLKAISPEAVWVAPLGVIFAWHHTVLMGFTNNAWSVALSFWLLAYWVESFSATGLKNQIRNFTALSVLMLMVWLSHPMGWFYSLIGMAATSLGYIVYQYTSHSSGKAFKTLGIHTLAGFFTALPGVVLTCQFYLSRNWKPETNKTPANLIAEQLLRLDPLINFNVKERFFLIGLSIFILLLFFWVLYSRLRDRKILPCDGFFLLFVAMTFILLNQPRSLTGGLEVGIRLGIFPTLSMLMWMGARAVDEKMKRIAGWGAILISAGLLTFRYPEQAGASSLAKEIVSCADSIASHSTILALNYDWNGQNTDGKMIGNRIWLFNHVDTYLGTLKPLVISDNYEANYWYFPIVEQPQTNMYQHTSDSEGRNFDHRPPCADILNYPHKTGGKYIDYVLMVSYRDEFADHACTRHIFAQLDSAYTEVFRSEHGRAILYRKK